MFPCIWCQQPGNSCTKMFSDFPSCCSDFRGRSREVSQLGNHLSDYSDTIWMHIHMLSMHLRVKSSQEPWGLLRVKSWEVLESWERKRHKQSHMKWTLTHTCWTGSLTLDTKTCWDFSVSDKRETVELYFLLLRFLWRFLPQSCSWSQSDLQVPDHPSVSGQTLLSVHFYVKQPAQRKPIAFCYLTASGL